MTSQTIEGVTLFVREPGGRWRQQIATAPTIRIGSRSDQDVVVSSLAPAHAVLSVAGSAFSLATTAAATIDGIAVTGTRVAVAPGATIGLGAVQLRARLDPAPTTIAEPGLAATILGDDGVRALRSVGSPLRREILRRLLDRLDLVRLDRTRLNDYMLRAKVINALRGIVAEVRDELPAGVPPELLVDDLTHEAIGLGPLDELLADAEVSEIMVLDASTVFVERGRHVDRSTARFTDEDATRSVLERIVAPLGRRIDEASPMLDARLPDGSRVNAVIGPVALRGTCITIRKFPAQPFVLADLLTHQSLSPMMARLLTRAVRGRKNILISGGTGSGKTTLLNVLSGSIPDHERVVTIEDAAELRLQQPHVVSLEGRPPNLERQGEITIRDLVRNAMRMRPDRIIVGECRGAEAIDMLQAMNTGHDGSMTTTHANSPDEALKRIEMLCLMSGLDVPSRALREQIGLSIQLVVQQARLSDGRRRVTSISEVTGVDRDGEVATREIFGFRRSSDGGEFYATGYVPSFLGDLRRRGLITAGEPLL
jgi:pilus assembly protein CpaF